MLGHLNEHDLIETGIDKDDKATSLASSELAVHRAIYRETPATAIVHAHSPHAVALSLVDNEIIPYDVQGSCLIQRVPVLGWKMKLKPGDLAEDIAQALKLYTIIMVYSHGCFARNLRLKEAYRHTSTLEESSRIIYLSRMLGYKP